MKKKGLRTGNEETSDSPVEKQKTYLQQRSQLSRLILTMQTTQSTLTMGACLQSKSTCFQ